MILNYLISWCTQLLLTMAETTNGRYFAYTVHSFRNWRLSRRLESRFARSIKDIKDPNENGLLPKESDLKFERPSKTNPENIYVYAINSSGQSLRLDISWSPNLDEDSGLIRCHLKLVDTDGTSYTYTEAERIYNLQEYNEYRVGGLRLEIVVPLKRIKLRLNGFCSATNNSTKNDYKYVKLIAIILPVQEAFDHLNTFDNRFIGTQICQNPASTLSDGFPFPDIVDIGLHVKLNISVDGESGREINLWGLRSKYYLPSEVKGSDRIIRFSAFSVKKGYNFSVAFIEHGPHWYMTGWAGWGLALIFPFKKSNLTKKLTDLDNFEFNLSIETRQFQVTVKRSPSDPTFYRLTMNGVDAIGHKVTLPFTSDHAMFTKPIRDVGMAIACVPAKLNTHLVLSINDLDATNSLLSGGKGSSLAKLTQIIGTNPSLFNVPSGVIVTTNSYQLMSNKVGVNNLVERVKHLIRSHREEQIETECLAIVARIESSPLPESVREAIELQLSQLFGPDWADKRFAVRSSAVGEDSEELSCAGQMETFLGVSSRDEIARAVMKCWASQFRFVAIGYKRSNGLNLDLEMAVVIQEMINCEKAGVLFTVDPITGDPRTALITANYGLGESVVSAASEPDTIKVSLSPTSDGLKVVTVSEITVGSKEKLIQLDENGNGTVMVDRTIENTCCLDKNEITRLTSVSLKVASFFSGPCDLEWGLKSGQLYLFQCRPVTTTSPGSDEWELSHEMDSPHASENEYHTRANLGEVYPGSTSHICYDLQMPMSTLGYISEWIKNMDSFRFVPYVSRGLAFCRHHNFFSLKDGVIFRYDTPPEKENLMTTSMEYAMLGQKIDDVEMKRDSYERLSLMAQQSAFSKFRMLYELVIKGPSRLAKVKLTEFKPEIKPKTSAENYKLIVNNPDYLWEVFIAHFSVTMGSSVMNLFVMQLLSKQDKNNPAMFTDFSKLLSSCEQIVSAQVPRALKNMASKVTETSEREFLLKASDSELVEYLETGKTEVSAAYQSFMETFGHRGLKEFDWAGKIWRKDPSFITSSLRGLLRGQTMPGLVMAEKPELSDDELIDSLETKLSRVSRFLLKRFFLRWCRKYVAHREDGKNKLIWMIDQTRKRFDEMARLLAYQEHRIPDPSLVYYLMPNEIEELTVKSNPRLVSLAKKRRKVLEKMDSYEFPIIMKGPEMRPNNLDDDESDFPTIPNGEEIQGTPVSQGKIKGRLYVARKIEDAAGIKPGDILVTYSTDIGWSPYFPLIGGLITEIGGLISHGAVIAREFGLPCVVGISKACMIFKTGELIYMDACRGVITKLDDDANDDNKDKEDDGDDSVDK